uniref:TCF3 fusion partner isoform X2 n=1 Tax=Phascolarctos cinereus TaxID=38626 RepID=A0A6P5LLL8_PHACI|nr:TCF3 fusion partner isoform X2 [Phascolarctos cinereus]
MMAWTPGPLALWIPAGRPETQSLGPWGELQLPGEARAEAWAVQGPAAPGPAGSCGLPGRSSQDGGCSAMAGVGFEEFSAPPGSELALPPLFGGHILESELETEVEFVGGALGGPGLREREEEEEAARGRRRRQRELSRRKYQALGRRCREIEQVNERVLNRLHQVQRITRRLRQERRMRVAKALMPPPQEMQRMSHQKRKACHLPLGGPLSPAVPHLGKAPVEERDGGPPGMDAEVGCC